MFCEPALPLVVPISTCNDPFPTVLWVPPPASHNVLLQLPVARDQANWSLTLWRTPHPMAPADNIATNFQVSLQELILSSSSLSPLSQRTHISEGNVRVCVGILLHVAAVAV